MTTKRRGSPRPNLREAGAPYRWRPGQAGNPRGRSKAVRVSEAINQELARKGDDERTRAEVLAANLVQRAELSTTELEMVIRITEPKLLADDSGVSGVFAAAKTPEASIVVGKLFGKG